MTTFPLKSCLIANRGEIAVRISRACRELGIRAVAVYSEADAHAFHVRQADHAVLIGAAAPRESYLNIPRLIEAALQSGCDCVHPGYGFLSENADFAQAVIDAGLVWIGASPDAIRAMGVKTGARSLMEAAGVPLVPGFQSDSASEAEFSAAAERIGVPIIVKAAGGGGGKGIRVVRALEDIPEAVQNARSEAQSAFGDARVFLERYIEGGRHIEIQILADQHGNVRHLFERDCSAQRRHQKVIEESPSVMLNKHPNLRQEMGDAAIEAARAVNYVNAGTVEFIVTPQGEFYFLEMNTRLQVEHPVTEFVTGHDLVKWQFKIAAGERIDFSQADLTQRGHAIEARLYAEDAQGGFIPAPGTLINFTPAVAPFVRVDAGVESGDTISLHYDPMIAKIIVYDESREGAIRRLDAALRDSIILGTVTNRDFLRALITHPTFAAGDVDTTFIERNLDELIPTVEIDEKTLHLALIAAALSELTQTSTQPADASPRHADPWARTDSFRIGG